MKFLKITLTLSGCFLLLTGCFRYYEMYEFKSNEHKFKWGVVGAKLIGSEKVHRKTITKSSPYSLLIWFGSNKYMDGAIDISELTLVNFADQKVVFERYNIAEKPIQKDSNIFRAYYSFKNIKLEHEDMVLQIKFSLNQGNQRTEYKADIFFEKDYQTFRRLISH